MSLPIFVPWAKRGLSQPWSDPWSRRAPPIGKPPQPDCEYRRASPASCPGHGRVGPRRGQGTRLSPSRRAPLSKLTPPPRLLAGSLSLRPETVAISLRHTLAWQAIVKPPQPDCQYRRASPASCPGFVGIRPRRGQGTRLSPSCLAPPSELRSALSKLTPPPRLCQIALISARDGCNISAAYGYMGSHRRRCSFSHIGGFGVINCATGSNASTGGGLPFHTSSRKNLLYRSLSFAAVRGFDTREFPVRLLQIPCYRTPNCLFDPPGKSLISLILSEIWRRIRRDLWTFFKISLLAGNLAFIADRF